MASVEDQLQEVSGKITAAATAVNGDAGASPVLIAVVREFEAKAGKAVHVAAKGPERAREAVVELEQAGDSAKAAAEADSGATDGTKQAVLDAHLSICMLKGNT